MKLLSRSFLVVCCLATFACSDDAEKKGTNNVSQTNNQTTVPNNQTTGTNNVVGTNNQTTATNNQTTAANNQTDNNVVSTAAEVDPNCVDGTYSEALPTPGADISSELASYSEGNLVSFYDAVLKKRFPVGAWLVTQGLTNEQFDCVDAFSSNTATAAGAIGSLSTVVHECGHIYNFTLSNDSYGVTPALQLSCSGGDTTDRGGETFARSRLKTDAFYALRPDCDDVGADPNNCDFYASVYLDGNPDDATFDGGDQGFNSVLEETLQYVNSLATEYAFQDFIGGSTSALDGILTFLWYVERYLAMARTEFPDAYAKLSGDPCWRNAILTVWGRAWIMLEAGEGNQSLGIDDAQLFELVRNPVLLGEIQRLRDLEGC